MPLQFAFPALWFGLFALLIPLAIHLWSRQQGRTRKVGSIRWYGEAENPRMSAIQLHDLPLLLLRLWIACLLVALLAGPLWKTAPTAAEAVRGTWLIQPDVWELPYVQEQAQAARDSGMQVQWLAQGFPPLAPENADFYADEAVNLFELLPQLDLRDDLPEPLFVMGHFPMKLFAGRVRDMDKTLNWLPVPKERTEQIPLLGRQRQGEGLQIFYIHASDTALHFDWGAPRPNALPSLHWNARPLRCLIAHAPNYRTDAAYLAAAVNAAAQFSPWLQIELAVQPTEGALQPAQTASLDWLAWLHPAALPTDLPDSLAVVQLCSATAPRYNGPALAKHRLLCLPERLDPAVKPELLAENLAAKVLQHMAAHLLPDTAWRAHDLREFPADLLPEGGHSAMKWPKKAEKQTRSLDLLFWLLLALSLTAERVLSYLTRN